MKKFISNFVNAILSMAHFNLFLAANTASSTWAYQPKEPESLKRYKK